MKTKKKKTKPKKEKKARPTVKLVMSLQKEQARDIGFLRDQLFALTQDSKDFLREYLNTDRKIKHDIRINEKSVEKLRVSIGWSFLISIVSLTLLNLIFFVYHL